MSNITFSDTANALIIAPQLGMNAEDAGNVNYNRNALADKGLRWNEYDGAWWYRDRRYSADAPPILLTSVEPLDVADKFIEMCFTVDGLPTLIHYGGDYLQWQGQVYREVEDAEVSSKLLRFLERVLLVIVDDNGRIIGVALPPISRHLLSETEFFMKRRTFRRSDTHIPSWIGGELCQQPKSVIEPTSLVFGKSTILNLDNMETLLPSPGWFNMTALEYDPDPKAECPQWLAFLDSVFGDDEESKQTLMEFIGLCATHITKFQKALSIIGPKRSGKGTIARITQALIGEHNSATQGTADFGQNFGVAELIGKTLTVVPDARFDGRNMGRLTEKILSIVGEDTIKINRKFKEALHVRLTTKLMLLSNVVPTIPDPSGALPSRFIFIKTPHSFYGREDIELERKLRTELPGIFNFAIKHLHNLLKRGRFIQPESGKVLQERMVGLSSPIGEFAKQLQPYTHPETVWAEWEKFCEFEGLRPGKTAAFWRDLEAAGYDVDHDAARVLAKIRQCGGEATARELRECSRKYHDAEVLDQKLRAMVKLGLLKVRCETTANNRIVDIYSEVLPTP